MTLHTTQYTKEQLDSLNAYTEGRHHSSLPIANPLVGYSGTLGSYAEEAAINHFGEDCRRCVHQGFEAVFKSIADGSCDYGVLPVENSSTGSIAAVYDLMARYRCYIASETQIKVEHCLLGVPGTTLDTIEEVYSHAQGFSQSEEYLQNHPNWKTIPYYNTAVSAAYIADCGDLHKAAIASRRAAAIHHLDILDENINFSEHNVTRFLIVSKFPEVAPNRDKISLAFRLPHTAGALYHVLGIFDTFDLNLCKIESRPIRDENWSYLFFIDFLGNISDSLLDVVMEAVISRTEGFHFLGYYPS